MKFELHNTSSGSGRNERASQLVQKTHAYKLTMAVAAAKAVHSSHLESATQIFILQFSGCCRCT
jgi:hypothetical protein